MVLGDKVKLLKDILTCDFYVIIILKIKIEVLCAFTMQGTRWSGLASRINPGVYGNRSVVSRALTTPKARGRPFVLEFVSMRSMNVPGLNNEPPWGFGALVYGSWKQLLCIQMQDFMQALKKETFHI